MAFASWYSITKNLPDANVKIYCDREKTRLLELFKWPNKVGVEFTYNCPNGRNVINCTTMVVRDWRGFEVCNAKENDIKTFVDYQDGCGKFVVSDWINKIESPFAKVDHLMNEGMSLNELKIFGLWRNLSPIYLAVG
jgi:hypothetical protein